MGNLRARLRIPRRPRQLPGSRRGFRRRRRQIPPSRGAGRWLGNRATPRKGAASLWQHGPSLWKSAPSAWKSGPSGPRRPREAERALAPVAASSEGRPQPLKADAYVFACGPWLGKLFPRTIGDLVQPHQAGYFFLRHARWRQSLQRHASSRMGRSFHFENRLSSNSSQNSHQPAGRFIYGIPGLLSDARRGFKIADDTRGPAFDPTNGERVVNPETLERLREYIAFRFPALKNAPLLETRVCQYEQTPDSHFIIDRHPKMENVWIVGGGSGHGFKHGPAIGEMMAELILKDREPPAFWSLARFKNKINHRGHRDPQRKYPVKPSALCG